MGRVSTARAFASCAGTLKNVNAIVRCNEEGILMNELKEAIHDFRTEQSRFNFIKVLEQLRNSWVSCLKVDGC